MSESESASSSNAAASSRASASRKLSAGCADAMSDTTSSRRPGSPALPFEQRRSLRGFVLKRDLQHALDLLPAFRRRKKCDE